LLYAAHAEAIMTGCFFNDTSSFYWD